VTAVTAGSLQQQWIQIRSTVHNRFIFYTTWRKYGSPFHRKHVKKS